MEGDDVNELERIVRGFAAGPWIYDSYICFQCKSLVNADGTMDEEHSKLCPYAAAVRWVEANPT